jgi:hypothetical protein
VPGKAAAAPGEGLNRHWTTSLLVHENMGTCEKAVENGASGAVFSLLSTASQHVGHRRFRLLRQALAFSSLHAPAVSRLSPHPSSRKGPILAPRSLTPEVDFSQSLVGYSLRLYQSTGSLPPSSTLHLDPLLLLTLSRYPLRYLEPAVGIADEIWTLLRLSTSQDHR